MTSPVGATPHSLDIPGTWNARDVGGRARPRGADRPLATGVLLRTASLSKVTDAGVAVLGDLGVQTVCDLRGEEEVQRDGADRVPSSARVMRRAMDPSAGIGHGAGKASADTAAMVAHLVDADDPTAMARRMMMGVYRTFVFDPVIRTQVARTLDDLAAARAASLVHCSAGKDRTGWVVALVQYVCGVDDDDRMAEYLESAVGVESLAATMPPIPGLDGMALMPLLTVEPDYLASAWAAAIEEFGSMDSYLAACGVTDATRDVLAGRLVG